MNANGIWKRCPECGKQMGIQLNFYEGSRREKWICDCGYSELICDEEYHARLKPDCFNYANNCDNCKHHEIIDTGSEKLCRCLKNANIHTFKCWHGWNCNEKNENCAFFEKND